MCVADYKIRRRCYTKVYSVITSGANALVLPPNANRVGLSFGVTRQQMAVRFGIDPINSPYYSRSLQDVIPASLDLDFVRHGPIVQNGWVIENETAIATVAVVETLLDNDLGIIIQQEGL